jgi:CheY-like chemotaxis protein
MQRILIVDDERNMRRVLEMLFGSHGYSTITAASGDEAIEILDQGEPVDLVLSDLGWCEVAANNGWAPT